MRARRASKSRHFTTNRLDMQIFARTGARRAPRARDRRVGAGCVAKARTTTASARLTKRSNARARSRGKDAGG